MNTTADLLRRYTLFRDEDAFHKVVARYFDFVHGVAFRRLNCDSVHALDIVQIVFTDLARKAHKLRDDSQLGGWLHQHTCFVASKFLRSETRRIAREQHAAQMQSSDLCSEDPWTAIAPIIDETLRDLAEVDRSAILLRYFEGRDLRSVGETLHISEDAAQKRVHRALERLKRLLEQKGIAVSAIALGLVLTNNASPAVASPPIDRIARAATSKHFSTSTISRLANFRTAVASIAALVLLLFFLRAKLTPALNQVSQSNTVDQPVGANTPSKKLDATTGATSPPGSGNSDTLAIQPDATADTLLVHVVDASTRDPIPRAKVRISNGVPPQPSTVFVEGDTLIVADEKGAARIPLTSTRQDRLMLQTYADDRADWVSIWDKSKGEIVPAEYTVALERGIPLGGRILDAEGHAISGAEVQIGIRFVGKTVRSHQQMQVRPLTNLTDAAGVWLDTHVPESLVSSISINLKHPEFAKTLIMPDSDILTQLRDHSFAIKLAKGFNVAGRVTTQQAEPITNALVSYGRRSYAYRLETTTDGEGRYTLKNISPEGFTYDKSFSVIAPTFAAANQQLIKLSATNELNFTLEAGGIIRGRVVNADGEPLSNVRVIREPSSPHADDGIEWLMITESDGRFFWNGAPNSPQNFYFGVPGYIEIRNHLLAPQDEDYVIVLRKPGLLKGTVVDANSGQPIPTFFIALAQGTTDHLTRSDTMEQEFKNGSFELDFGGSTYNLVHVRAPGYLTGNFQISPESKVVAALHPSRAIEGVIVDTVGRPVRGAEVAAVPEDPRREVAVGKGRLILNPMADRTHTDDSGHFKLSISAEADVVVAAHPEHGFAEIPLSRLDPTTKVTLLPWGRIEGTLMSNKIPLANEEIALLSFGAVPLDYNDFKRPVTGPDGRFSFEHVPPVPLHLHHQPPIEPVPPGQIRVYKGPIPAQTNFTVAPGAVTYIELDAANPPVLPTNAPPKM